MLLHLAINARLDLSDDLLEEINLLYCDSKLQQSLHKLAPISKELKTLYKPGQFLDIIKHGGFTEHVIKDAAIEEAGKYDVTYEGFHCCETDEVGNPCKVCMTKAFVHKLEALPFHQLASFLSYQVSIREDKLLFLEELEGLLMDNWEYFNVRSSARLEHLTNLIKKQLEEFNVSHSKAYLELKEKYDELIVEIEKLIRAEYYWKGDKTQLMELIVVLTEAGLIADKNGNSIRKHITEYFEKVLNFPMLDPEKTVSKIKAKTHLRLPQLMETFIKVFETWQRQVIEK